MRILQIQEPIAFLMNSDIADKQNQFRNSIRRKQIDAMFKEQREHIKELLLNQKNGTIVIHEPPSINSLLQWIQQASIKSLYSSLYKSKSFVTCVPIHLYDPLIALIMTESSLKSLEGLLLLGLAIQHTCFSNHESPARKCMLEVIEKHEIVEKVYRMAVDSFEACEVKRTRAILQCLKSLSIGHVQRVRDEDLLQKYLGQILGKAMEEPSVLILMSYISEKMPFPAEVVLKVCCLAYSKENIIKLSTSNILINYCILEVNGEHVITTFLEIFKAFQHLYISYKEYRAHYNIKILDAMTQLIAKYPSQFAHRLIAEIRESKVLDLLEIITKISHDSNKPIVFKIYCTYAEKVLEGTKSSFCEIFPEKVLNILMIGVESSYMEIIASSLKLLLKMAEFLPDEALFKLDLDYDLSLNTDHLSFHNNDFISSVAEELKQIFDRIKQQYSGALMN